VTSPSGEVTLADARVSPSSHEPNSASLADARVSPSSHEPQQPQKTYPTEFTDHADANIIAKFVQPWEKAVYGPWFIYLTASSNRNALYTGSTDNLARRNEEHKRKNKRGFSNKYNAERLVYFEAWPSKTEAELREQRLKTWRRSWKNALVDSFNPAWDDLYDKIVQRT